MKVFKAMERPNYYPYIQDSMYNQMNKDSFYSVNVTLLLRIKSSLRLNLIDADGKKMIEEDDQSEEVHFMQVEKEFEKFAINMSSIKRLFQAFFRMKRQAEDNPEMQGWTVTDFDYHLSGNPHVK